VTLVITRLEVEWFRNWDHKVVEPDPSLTVIVGPNATGKTNLIEAIQLVTEADSFRHPAWLELITWGRERSRVKVRAEGDERVLEVDLEIGPTGRRVYRVNGKIRRKIAEVAGVVPAVVFTPEDLFLVKGSADKRRAELDALGSQLSPTYSQVRAEYDRVVRQRNALLKEQAVTSQTTAVWDERLLDLGTRLYEHRRRLFERVREELVPAYAALAPEETLSARYLASWERDGWPEEEDSREAFARHLQRKAAEERARGTTLAGPHRDEIAFEIDGRDARTYASQGQQRTVALAWKLAEVRVVTGVAAQPPVLLLDDVMSELDEQRRHCLATFVGQAAQTFVTTTNLGYFDPELIRRATVVEL